VIDHRGIFLLFFMFFFFVHIHDAFGHFVGEARPYWCLCNINIFPLSKTIKGLKAYINILHQFFFLSISDAGAPVRQNVALIHDIMLLKF
jgi:hypothetical protein